LLFILYICYNIYNTKDLEGFAMNVYEAILKRRTIRKFKQEELHTDTLKKFVNAARLAPQAANIQPLKYVIVNEKPLTDELFKACSWAGYIKPLGNPAEGERPTAYIIVLVDAKIKKASYDLDAGAAIENILLTALEDGIGTCWLGAINRDKIRHIMNIPEKYIIQDMVALGYPAEDPVTDDAGVEDSIKYYKDENGTLHVPKRKIEDVLFLNKDIK
jgi:nitroreductase